MQCTFNSYSEITSSKRGSSKKSFQKHLKYDYTQYENVNVDTKKYGGTKEYTTNKNYPNIFAKEKTGWVDEMQGTELNLSEQTIPINETKTTANEKIKIINTYWCRGMTSIDFDSENTPFNIE